MTIESGLSIICPKCIFNSAKPDNCYTDNNYSKFYLLEKKLQIFSNGFKLIVSFSLQILNYIFKVNLHELGDLAHAKLSKYRAG